MRDRLSHTPHLQNRQRTAPPSESRSPTTPERYLENVGKHLGSHEHPKDAENNKRYCRRVHPRSGEEKEPERQHGHEHVDRRQPADEAEEEVRSVQVLRQSLRGYASI